jgi:hypothetical protein
VRASSSAFVLLLLWTTAGASAQPTTVTTQPAAPTHSTSVTIILSTPCGCPGYDGSTIVRNGFTFDFPYGDGCLSACLPTATPYDVGPLPAGTYTVRHFLQDQPATVEVIGSFVVGAPGPATVPTLGASGLALLALLLAAGALLTLRRRAGGPV